MAGLAARCTACGTVFRVVPDQLRVAGGYVRCGRCSAVFNAAESLIDLDSVVAGSPAPVEPPPPAPEPAAEPEAAAAAQATVPEPLADLPAPVEAAAPEEPEPEAESGAEVKAPAPEPVQAEAVEVPAAEPEPEQPLAEPAATGMPDLADLAEPEPVAAAAVENPAPAPEPGTDFDLEFLDPPPAAPEVQPEALPEPVLAAAADAFELDLPQPDPAPGRIDIEVPQTETETAALTGLEGQPERIDYDPQAASAPMNIELTLPPPTPDAPPHQLSLQTAPAEDDLPLRAEPADKPSFVRSAERSQRWETPALRRRLAVGVALGVLLLAGQAVFTWRDEIVARWPGSRPIIEPPCVAFGCRIEAPRAIEALAIESSGLVRVEKSAVYKLQVALRNRSAREVALPALDLTLSDAQGKPLARRVLRAADFGVNVSTLAAGREVALQATLQAQFPGGEPVAGYTIDPFYP